MGSCFSIVGIIVNTIGTIITLWKLISINQSYVGTAEEFDNRSKEFPKEKRCAIGGLIAIVVGNALQIIGVLL